MRRDEVATRPELKHTRWLWLKNHATLSAKQQGELHQLMRPCTQLATARARRWREDFQAFYDQDPSYAPEYLRRWCYGAKRSRLQAIKDFVTLVEKHRDGILAWPANHLSNGLLEGINSLVQAAKARARGYRSKTGFHHDEIVDLTEMINAVPVAERESWPPVLGLFKSVVIALTYLRRNRVQWELAETYGVSQSTISRAITALTPLLAKVLQKYVPTAEELDADRQYIVDGTLLPCWSWASRPELYSGKHKTTGVNVQVACTLDGVLAWISDPVDGSRHDTHCLRESEVLLSHDPEDWMGDKGYVGNDMLTPIKKPTHRDLLDWEKKFNSQINEIRYVIEQTIANFKTWRILHTDYRRPFETFATTISAAIGLHFYAFA